jgi:threonine aldolase
METIDLRSDTVTKPSPEMRTAMLAAEVGDDVYGEDPTVNRLQEKVARLLGKEAALFIPSGVMANQVAIKVHTQPGDEVIVERESHIFNYETAAAAVLSRVQLNTIKGIRGILNADQIARELRSPAYYNPRVSLLCLENTHNKAGGTIYPLEEIARIRALAKKRNIAMHLDGARIWNASVATGIAPRQYAKHFDTVSVCFSKGLGAPVGSALVGTKQMIDSARTYRKIFGGGMRQVGILAAGALYALEHNIDRLNEDHAKAQTLAKAAASIQGIEIDIDFVQTNIVIMNIQKRKESAEEMLARLKRKGVLLSEIGHARLRAVTHIDVTHDQIVRASEIMKAAFDRKKRE